MTSWKTESRAKKHFFSKVEDVDALITGRRVKAGHIIGLLESYTHRHPVQRALSIGSSYCLIEEEIKHRLLKDAEFFCIDMDAEALQKFDQPELIKKVMSATELDFPDNHFDFVLAHQVLEHINEYPEILVEFRRICRPGGLVYINVPNPLSPMIGKEPSGSWPKPILGAFVRHNLKKLKRDFLSNTEKYHTGFTTRYLKRAMPEFNVHDLRKDRLRQEFTGKLAHWLITLFPTPLLFLLVETNIWCLEKHSDSVTP